MILTFFVASGCGFCQKSIYYEIYFFCCTKNFYIYIYSKVLQKSISYLTKAHLDEIEDLKNKIIELEKDKSDIFEFLIKKYKNIKKEIKRQLERQEAEKEA